VTSTWNFRNLRFLLNCIFYMLLSLAIVTLPTLHYRSAASTRVLEYYSSSKQREYFLLLECSSVSISGCTFSFPFAFFAVNKNL